MYAPRALVLASALLALGACADFAKEAKSVGRTLTDPKSWKLGSGEGGGKGTGSARGAASAEDAKDSFLKAIQKRDRGLLLEVTCHGKTRASCKHREQDKDEADEWLSTAKEMKWDRPLGSWTVRANQEMAFAFDTWPGSSRVSAVSACRIVEPDDPSDAGDAELRWGICNVQEIARSEATRLSKR